LRDFDGLSKIISRETRRNDGTKRIQGNKVFIAVHKREIPLTDFCKIYIRDGRREVNIGAWILSAVAIS